MEHFSIVFSVFFLLITILTIGLFYRATNHSFSFLIGVLLWGIAQSIISYMGFYQNTSATPPRFGLLLLPTLIYAFSLPLTTRGRAFLKSLNLKKLTLLHTIRIPVEITLYLLFLKQYIPVSMTFEGFNLDILSGISAPIIFYWVFVAKKWNKKALLIWNIIALGLLVNIVTIAILSAPSPFQQFSFDTPNIGILYFPISLLPAIIVPLVLLSHVAAIYQLTTKNEERVPLQ